MVWAGTEEDYMPSHSSFQSLGGPTWAIVPTVR